MQWLIAINVAIYFLQLTVVRPEDVQQTLGFEVHDLGRSWWTIATYMFVHGGCLHLAPEHVHALSVRSADRACVERW